MRNKTILAVISAALLVCASLSANAGLISGSHLTDDGKNVNLSGLIWHTWDIYNISRADVETLMLTGGIYEDYRYATRSEFETLFGSLWGGTAEGWHTTNADGGNWLRDNFGGLFTSSSTGSNVFFGEDGSCTANVTMSCRAHWRSDGYTGNNIEGMGWFDSEYGLGLGAGVTNTNNTYNKANSSSGLTHALVLRSNRTVTQPVPEPSTLAIFALGMIGLASRRFKKQS